MIINNVWRPYNVTDGAKTSWFQPSVETLRETDNILNHTYFLVLQGSEFGERLRCRECNRRHDYITLRCVPRPITGLMNGLYAYYRIVKDHGIEHQLSKEERTRLENITQILSTMPDLADVHPETARKLSKDMGANDLHVGAVSLGVLEGISPKEAKDLEDRINLRGIKPPFRLHPISATEQLRSAQYKGMQYTSSRW